MNRCHFQHAIFLTFYVFLQAVFLFLEYSKDIRSSDDLLLRIRSISIYRRKLVYE